MNRVTQACTTLLTIAAVFIGIQNPRASAEPPVKKTHVYEVSITNLTRGQNLAPALLYTHTEDTMPLFHLGSPASPELAALAEDADTSGLVASLSADSTVHDIQMLKGEMGVIAPGETAHIMIEAPADCTRLSLGSMLVTTNDAFIGMAGMKLPRKGQHTHMAAAYDAGSEANTEQCEHIPGPPCGNAGMRMPEGAEGYVHVHSGLHGVGDLMASDYDWRNPVAKVVIRRVRH